MWLALEAKDGIPEALGRGQARRLMYFARPGPGDWDLSHRHSRTPDIGKARPQRKADKARQSEKRVGDGDGPGGGRAWRMEG